MQLGHRIGIEDRELELVRLELAVQLDRLADAFGRLPRDADHVAGIDLEPVATQQLEGSDDLLIAHLPLEHRGPQILIAVLDPDAHPGTPRLGQRSYHLLIQDTFHAGVDPERIIELGSIGPAELQRPLPIQSENVILKVDRLHWVARLQGPQFAHHVPDAAQAHILPQALETHPQRGIAAVRATIGAAPPAHHVHPAVVGREHLIIPEKLTVCIGQLIQIGDEGTQGVAHDLATAPDPQVRHIEIVSPALAPLY